MINSIKESHVGNVLKYLENAGYVRREGMGYLFEITPNERNKLVENFDRFKTMKHSTVKPKAFTDKELYMLATILKSPQATETTLAIIETYAKLKQFVNAIHEIRVDRF